MDKNQLFSFFCEKLSAQLDTVYFVQIGAMDGVLHDPLHEIIKKHHWQGVLVEPLPDQFEKLRSNYESVANLQFANVAIDSIAGKKIFYRIDPSAIGEAGLADWSVGISSFSRQHLASHDYWCHGLSQYIIETQVDAITLTDLLRQCPLPRIDMLQIDVEGHDWVVLSQLDFAAYKPRLINIEYARLSEEDKSKALQCLLANDYMVTINFLDLLAIHPNLM